MVEAVLFDYGMVLSGPAHPPAWREMMRITGLDEPAFNTAYWSPRHEYDRGTHTGRDYWQTVGRQAHVELTQEQISALLDADIDLWTQPNQPMIDWARRLQDAGTRTGILSNLGDAMESGVRARMPWLESFDHHTFSHRLRLAKPEAAIYRHAAKGLGAEPNNILFIDDRADNCEAGRAAGMQVISYTSHSDFMSEMDRLGLTNLWQNGTSS